MRNRTQQYFARGWCRFGFDPRLRAWVEAAYGAARATLDDPQHRRWHRYDGTWFAGVNALGNDASGAVGGSGALAGDAVDFIDQVLGLRDFAWDAAQVSVCFPGYPQPMAGESEARLRFRRERDAAHVDGLLGEGPDRHRHLREHHGFVLGIAMNDFDPGASPFVIYEGSHELMRAAFAARFAGIAPADWGDEDVTETYQAARRAAFADCQRTEIHARPGEAFVVHRLALHGTAPWCDGAAASPDGRMICFFRPPILDPASWLNDP